MMTSTLSKSPLISTITKQKKNNSNSSNNTINDLVTSTNPQISEPHNPKQSFPKAGHILSKVYQTHHSDNNSDINSVNSHLLQLSSGIKPNIQKKSINNNNYDRKNENESNRDIIASGTPTKKSSSSGGDSTRTVDTDEEPLNVYSISGFFYKSLVFLISYLPTSLVEKLLLLFAWIQLELLKAKGRNLGGTQQSFSKLKKKRKSQKKKKNKLNIASALSSNSTAAILSSPFEQINGPIPVAHSKSSPLVANKHQRRFSLSSSTPGLNSILKSHGSSNNIVGLSSNPTTTPPLSSSTTSTSSSSQLPPLLSTNGHTGIQHLNAIKDKLLYQQQKHLQQKLLQKQQFQQQQLKQQEEKQQQPLKLFETTSIPDQIPVTIAPTFKFTGVESTPELSSASANDYDDDDEQHSGGKYQPITAKNLSRHRTSITELPSSDDNSDGGGSSGSGRAQNLKVTFSDDSIGSSINNGHSKILDWNTYLNPHHQMSQENLMLQQKVRKQQQLQQHQQNEQDDEHQQASLIIPRHRSDSISVLPSLLTKPMLSEIRRVNSEQTLFQSSEDTLRFEANQQSKKEFEDFLRSVKDIKDVHNWLRNFSCSASKKIAIVKISRRILDTPYGIESAASSLCFMYKFGLYPIVIHGGMNDISKLPISEVVKERRMRSALLKEAIKKNGVGCSVLTPDICEIEPYVQPNTNGNGNGDTGSDLSSDEVDSDGGGGVSRGGSGNNRGNDDDDDDDILPSGGLNMKIDSFDYDILTQVLDKGKIPVWDSVCESIDGVDIPINSDITTFELAKRIQPYKILFACNDGGILDSDHKAIPVVYMDQDYQTLVESDHTTNRRRVQLKQMKRIVDHLPSTTTVVVTSIENVTHQLLFPRLANGTIIKKSEDNKVLIFDSSNFTKIDMDRLRELIENSFGKMLSLDYFDYLKDSLYKMYLCVSSDGEYNGCAIVTYKQPDFIPYLCKFCVKKSAQGLGLGDLIWRVLQRDNDKLYWRSRNNNPLNPWYFQRCQGSFRADDSFTIFWYGDDKFEDGSFLIDTALKKPITVR